MSGGLYASTDYCHDEYPNSLCYLLFWLNLLIKKLIGLELNSQKVPMVWINPED